MEPSKLPIYLTKRQAELLIIAEYLDSLDFWGEPYTQSIIDWDQNGDIGSVYVRKGHKPKKKMGLGKIIPT